MMEPMLKTSIWLFATGVLAITLIIPRNYPNHRLTYSGGPRVINSAVNEETRTEDYFIIPNQIVNLPSEHKTMCSYPGRGIFACNKGSEDEVSVEIKDTVREVQFADIHGNCLTLGSYDSYSDSFEVIFAPCEDSNSGQFFILNKDHGHDGRRTIDRKNISITPYNKIRQYRQNARLVPGFA